MQRLSQCFLLACSLVMIPVLASNAQEAAEDPKAVDVPRAELLPKPQALPLSQLSHGVRLDDAGRLIGMATTIDPNSLELLPAGQVDVIFLQQGRIIAQARSNAAGQFVVSGLTPLAVYSVIARSANELSTGLYSAFSIAVFPSVQQVATTNRETQFTSLLRQNEEENAIGNTLTFTLIPARDLAAVGLPQAFPAGSLPGMVSPFGQAATGGGGGGGGGGGDIGALFAAAAAAAALASTSESDVASPFAP